MTKEEIARAKELDLLTYFKLVEPGNLKLVGKEYRHKVHSSLTISKNSLWCWHCIGLRGRTALKYLIDVEKVPYVEAVREINRIQGVVVHSSQPVSLPQPWAEPEVPRDFKLPESDTNSYAAMAYLRGRCIHPNVLAFCRREGILYQTSFKNHPNCVFVGRDGEGVAKGGSLRGCTQLQFRRDIPGSKNLWFKGQDVDRIQTAIENCIAARGKERPTSLLQELSERAMQRTKELNQHRPPPAQERGERL